MQAGEGVQQRTEFVDIRSPEANPLLRRIGGPRPHWQKIWPLFREFVFALDAIDEEIGAVPITLEAGAEHAAAVGGDQDLGVKPGFHGGLCFVTTDLAMEDVAVDQTISDRSAIQQSSERLRWKRVWRWSSRSHVSEPCEDGRMLEAAISEHR
jgi:hypothetical protein